jgi:N-acetylglucosamine kinase-like BadF-type ATPase
VTALLPTGDREAPTFQAPAAVLAIDGGNSKTDVALLGTDGAVLAAVRGPGSCHQSIGLVPTRELLTDLASQAAVAAGLDPSQPIAAHTSACLAGADLPIEVEQLTDLLEGPGWSRTIRVENDTFALLRAGTDAPNAVAVVCGAGINCVGVAADGRSARFPALGRLSGDWGGGGGLGSEALWLAVRAEDGRGEPTALREAVAAHFGMDSPMAVAAAIHLQELSGDRLNELAPVLMEVARAGDRIAMRVVDRLAEEVCLLATVALRRLELLGVATDLVLGGGVLTGSGPVLHDRIAERISPVAPLARIRLVSEPPVVGAALLGFDALGTAAGVEAAVRASLPAAEFSAR